MNPLKIDIENGDIPLLYVSLPEVNMEPENDSFQKKLPF